MWGVESMDNVERERLIKSEQRKYHREYMREYRQREGFKEKQKQYRENWLYNRAVRSLEDED